VGLAQLEDVLERTEPFAKVTAAMTRSPLLLSLLITAGLALAQTAPAQQDATPPAVDPAAVLATLKDLRTRQPAVVNRERANVLAAINAAIGDPGKAYEEAVTAVEGQGGGNGNQGARPPDWRKRQGDLLRNRDFVNGLRLQLIYLALSWQHSSGVKTANLINPLLDYTGQAAQAVETLTPFEQFRRGIAETVFAQYFQVAPFLSGMNGWEDHPFDVDGIFKKAILPELRQEKDPRLLTYWDSRIQTDGARAESSGNALIVNKFKNITLPQLLWSRALDEIALGRQNQAIVDMLAIVKAHPDHPDFQSWASQLEALVAPQVSPPPSPAASP
jgi:hypothetical protein